MNTNLFSEELQKMYRDILMQQHTMAYSSMVAAFAAAAENEALLSQQTTSEDSLVLEIPREDIECDIDIVVVRNLRENLQKIQTSLDGMHGKRFRFREVIEVVTNRPAYVNSPGTGIIKRNRLLSYGPLASSPLSSTPTTSTANDENPAKKVRTADDTAETLDESNASSHDGSLLIDWPDMLLPAVVPKKAEDATKSTTNKAASNVSSGTYKPSQLRIERLRNITKNKPKVDIECIDLTYHSNMARSFPGSEHRTDDQQARREKNCIAARVSRTKNKAFETMLDEKSLKAMSENINLKRKIACLRVYAKELMKANGFPDCNLNDMWEANVRDFLCVDE